MVYAGLLDGGLSVTVEGVERRSSVHGLEWESGPQGDGGGSFWMEVADPFNVRGTYSELHHGAEVIVTHQYDANPTKTLYKGYVVSDPRIGIAGGEAKPYVPIELGGVLEVAKWRQDCAFIFTDSDNDQWFEHKQNPKWAVCNTSESVYLGVEDGTVVRRRTPLVAAGMCYFAYLGAHYMLANPATSGLYGVKRFRAKANWNLKDNMKAGLYWRPDYSRSRNPANYTEIATWGPNTTGKNVTVDHTFGGTNGAGYVVLFLWKTVDDKKETTDERFIEFENPEFYLTSDGNERSVNGAMTIVANFVGLHSSTDTEVIGSLLQTLAVRPHTDPISGCQNFATQASTLVDWGWHQGVWRCKKMRTNPTTIRTLANYYKFDASTMPGIKWDVRQHPESENPARGVRLGYGRNWKSEWPAGLAASSSYPTSPGLVGGIPFRRATCPMLYVDFEDLKLTEAQAKAKAKYLWRHMSTLIAQNGPVEITRQTVLDKDGNPYPAPYLHGGDWFECTTGSATVNPGPLFITRCHVDADTGKVDMDVGLPGDVLVRQLEDAGRLSRVKKAPWKRWTRKG